MNKTPDPREADARIEADAGRVCRGLLSSLRELDETGAVSQVAILRGLLAAALELLRQSPHEAAAWMRQGADDLEKIAEARESSAIH